MEFMWILLMSSLGLLLSPRISKVDLAVPKKRPFELQPPLGAGGIDGKTVDESRCVRKLMSGK